MAEAAVIAAAYPLVYLPLLVIMPIMIFPIPAASATAEPDIPEKISEATTLTCPKPPLKRPTTAMQNFSKRSVIVPPFIMFAAAMNSGTANKTNDLYKPCKIFSPVKATSNPPTAK